MRIIGDDRTTTCARKVAPRAPALRPLISSPWLSCPLPTPSATTRLWCFPFAGGGAGSWLPWARALRPEIEVVAFRLPGRESRLAEPPLNHPEALLSKLQQELEPYLEDDNVLCGHSLGGLLAFAVLRRSVHCGTTLPRALIVSGIRAPHVARTEPDLHALADDELIAEIDRRYGGIPPELREDPALLELFLPALRADLRVYETFPLMGISPLDVPILALGGEADLVVPPDQLLAWAAQTSRRFQAAFLPGGHFFLQADPERAIACVRNFLAEGGGEANLSA